MAEISGVEAESFRILGVGPDASTKEIRAAFRQLAKLHHPDRNPGSSDAEERFKLLLTAYQTALRAIERRAEAADPPSATPSAPDPEHQPEPQPEPRPAHRPETRAAAQPARPRYEPPRGYVRRSRSSARRVVNRFLLFLFFTAGPMLFLLYIIWANTETDWIPNCCPVIRVEQQPVPFEPREYDRPDSPERPRKEGPAPLLELDSDLDSD